MKINAKHGMLLKGLQIQIALSGQIQAPAL